MFHFGFQNGKLVGGGGGGDLLLHSKLSLIPKIISQVQGHLFLQVARKGSL